MAQILRILQWLINFAPNGLAHAPSAFIHCCFVLSLARILNRQLPHDSEDYEVCCGHLNVKVASYIISTDAYQLRYLLLLRIAEAQH